MNRSIYLASLVALFSVCAPTNNVKKTDTKKDLETITCTGSDVIVDDGDTIICNGREIRILGIDTPEIEHPDHCLMEEQPYGREAVAYAEKVFKNAKKIEVITKEKDKYGRDLGHVFVDGELYALDVLRRGLAYEVVTFYGDNGFPDLATKILEVSNNVPKPKFEPPYIFRTRMKAMYGLKDENDKCVVKK